MKYRVLVVSFLVAMGFGVGIFSFLSQPVRAAATFTVNDTGEATDANLGDGLCETATGNGICTLQAAVAETNALPGADTILLAAATYTGGLFIEDDLTVMGSGTNQTFIDGRNLVLVFMISGPNYVVHIHDLTIQNGPDVPPFYASGIRVLGSTLFLDGITLTNNRGAALYLTDNDYYANLHITNSNIISNGRGIFAGFSNIIIENTNILENRNSDPVIGGGGVLFLDGVHADIYNSHIEGNEAAYGGGILNLGVLLRLGNVTIKNNIATDPATGYGGGIYSKSRMSINNSDIMSNTALAGGGIYYPPDTYPSLYNTIHNSNIMYNIATMNSAGEGGGGIYFGVLSFGDSPFQISNSNISHNIGEKGPAIHAEGHLEIVNVTINENRNTISGTGGILSQDIITITNSTIISNFADLGPDNGLAGSIVVQNTIIADGCLAPITSAGYNIEVGDSCGLNEIGDLVNTNPMLGPLQDNGGSTLTFALLPGSPAIEAGNNAVCPSTDQRFFPRPWDGDGDLTPVCDIGAFEFGQALVRLLPIVLSP